MNKNFTTILTAAAIALVTGCVTAGTWVNGCYIDGPLCTVCDGMKVVTHAYGTTVCTHCDGTGIEPPEETVVVENVIVDTWCPPPPRGHRPPKPHHRVGRVVPNARDSSDRFAAASPVDMQPHRNANRVNNRLRGVKDNAPYRPAAKVRPVARPAAPRGGGHRGGGVGRGRR